MNFMPLLNVNSVTFDSISAKLDCCALTAAETQTIKTTRAARAGKTVCSDLMIGFIRLDSFHSEGEQGTQAFTPLSRCESIQRDCAGVKAGELAMAMRTSRRPAQRTIV